MLAEYIGQQGVKDNLDVAIRAARKPLDPFFFRSARPRKNDARVCHRQRNGARFRSTAGPLIQLKATWRRFSPISSLAMSCSSMRSTGFINIEEILYRDGDYKLDIILGRPRRTHRLDLRRFTLIGATTRAGLILPSLAVRYGSPARLLYRQGAQFIIKRSTRFSMRPSLPTAAGNRQAVPGTPRVANRRLARDYAQVKGTGEITVSIARDALKLIDVAEHGFDDIDRKLLRAVIERFGGGPVGVNTIAAVLSEEVDAIEDIYEPYLLQIGFLQRTPRGRVATKLAYEHLGVRITRPRRIVLKALPVIDCRPDSQENP